MSPPAPAHLRPGIPFAPSSEIRVCLTDVGGFFGFGDSNLPEYTSFEGRFAEILPPKPPTQEMQSTARVVLKVMGITDASLRADPGNN